MNRQGQKRERVCVALVAAITTLVVSTPSFAAPGDVSMAPAAAFPATLTVHCSPGAFTAHELDLLDKSIQKSAQTISADPNAGQAYYDRGRVQAAKEQYDQAYKSFDRAIELNFRTADAYFSRGHAAHASTSRYSSKKIQNDFRKAVELDPQHAEAYYFLGVMAARKHAYGAAIVLYSKALEIDPGYSDVYLWRGDAFSELGEKTKAIQDYEKHAVMNPADGCAQIDLAREYDSMGQTGKAEAQYTKTLSAFPKFVPAHTARGEFYMKHKQPTKAVGDFSGAIAIRGHASSYLMRAKAHQLSGSPGMAIRDLFSAARQAYFLAFS